MVQSVLLLTSEPCNIQNINDKQNEASELNLNKSLLDRKFNNGRKIVNSKSLNCLSDSQSCFKDIISNDNNIINNNLVTGLIRKSKSLNELYYIQKTNDRNKKDIEINKNKAISTSKLEKCVRFNDEIKIHELSVEVDRRPMPLAKMYYKDQVELIQLREEMKQIQYRIINKIEGNVLLGN